ncbi:Homeobox-leucine zipper protein HAT4, partial [Linum perenne]
LLYNPPFSPSPSHSKFIFSLPKQKQSSSDQNSKNQRKMMAEKDDLGLSLSLSFHRPAISSSSSALHPHLSAKSWMMNPSSDLESERSKEITRSLLRGIDVNRLPAVAAVDCDEEAGVSSPNSTVSSISGKRSEREAGGDQEDLDGERASCDEEDGDTSRKKLRLSKDQSAVLEESFKEHSTLNPKQKQALAKQLGLRPRQVEVWFQNRRARTKLKQTEVDCEFLKRCCENLTDENRRLQKEVQELRALKLSPQFYMQMTPPTTLTMCPSCERVAVPPPPPSSSTSAPPPVSTRPTLLGPQAQQHRPNPWAAGGAFSALRPRS